MISRLPRRFLSGQALDLAEALLDPHQVGPPLRVEVLHDLREPQRQLALLPPLALVNELSHLRQQRAAVDVAAAGDALDAGSCGGDILPKSERSFASSASSAFRTSASRHAGARRGPAARRRGGDTAPAPACAAGVAAGFDQPVRTDHGAVAHLDFQIRRPPRRWPAPAPRR